MAFNFWRVVLTVSLSALDNLFRILALFGSMFSAKLWELIFRGVLLPIFDNIGYSKGKAEVVNAVCIEYTLVHLS